jgi:hypothetical protein
VLQLGWEPVKCEVMSHRYESFHTGTSNNVVAFLFTVEQSLLICTLSPSISTSWLLKKNRIRKQNTTQHNTHNTHNTQQKISRRRPTLQRLHPLTPWIVQRWPQVLAPRFTIGHCRHAVSGLLSPLFVPLFEPKNSTGRRIEWCEGGWP